MPVLPEFMPEGRPGEAADNFAQGRTEGESWMSMEQNRRIQAEQAQQQKDMFIAHLPVIHAQAQAQVAQANASVALSTQQQQLMAKSGIVAPDAQNEFLDALQYADPQTQFDELGKIQAKYAWLKLNPQYAPMLEAIDKARGDAFHLVTANNLAEATFQRTEMLTQAKGVQATEAGNVRKDVAQTNADAKIQAAETYAGSRQGVAETNAGARVEAATISAHSRENKSSKELASLQASEDNENAAAQEASASGDDELAKFHLARAAQYHDAAVKASTYAGNAPSEPAKAPPPTPKKKLYTPPSTPGDTPTFTPSVKSPDDVLKAVQQMVNDGAITPDQARDTLKRLGFKPKK